VINDNSNSLVDEAEHHALNPCLWIHRSRTPQPTLGAQAQPNMVLVANLNTNVPCPARTVLLPLNDATPRKPHASSS